MTAARTVPATAEQDRVGERGQISQTGTAYTVDPSYQGKLVVSSNAAAQTATVSPQPTAAGTSKYEIGGTIEFLQTGAGKLSVAQGAGVTINSIGGFKGVLAQHGKCTLTYLGSDTWSWTGQVATS